MERLVISLYHGLLHKLMMVTVAAVMMAAVMAAAMALLVLHVILMHQVMVLSIALEFVLMQQLHNHG